MNLESYDIVYIFGNIFMAYVIYQYMYVFYSSCRVSRFIECICYIGYFLGITGVHVLLEIPFAVFVANMIFIVLLTFIYDGNWKKSLLSTLIIYFSLMIIETIIVFITSSLRLDLLVPFDYKSEIGIVFIRLFSFTFVRWIRGFVNVKNELILPLGYWISLVVIPIGTGIMLFAVYMDEDLPRIITLICLCSAFLVNIVSFYLYDKIIGLMQEQVEKRVAEEQARLYEYQVQMMKEALENIRMLRHDMKNKMSVLYMMAQKGENKELEAHLGELIDICSENKEYAHSGNVTIDSIVNYKLQRAEEKHVKVKTDIVIPSDLVISTFDMAVILGNLLDNAMEATAYVKEEKRWIAVRMKYTKGRMIIEINNSYDGVLLNTSEGITSRKEDRENHGLGIKSIKKTLEKYDGVYQIMKDGTRFTVKVLIYL